MRVNPRLVTILFAFVILTRGAVALAEPGPSASDSTAWSTAYDDARAAMVSGNFAGAAEKFARLVQEAPDAPSRLLASELMSACRTWAAGGFVLAHPSQIRLAPPALLEDRRTTDEISILYTSAVLYGLYGGVVVDLWTHANSPSGAIPPPLFLAGAAAGTVALLDHTLHLGYGVAQSIVSGLYVGLEEGIAWSIWHEARAHYSDEWGDKAVTTLIFGTGMVGALAGGIVGSRFGTTPGRASLMGSAAMWGGVVAGTLMGGLTGNDDTAMLAAALTLNAGAVVGVLAGAEVSPSIARVRFIDLGGLSGALLVGGGFWAVRGKAATGRELLTASSLGAVSGLVTSWLLTREMEPDQPRQRRAPSFAERLLPTVAPASNGTGLVVGVASAI